MTNAYRILTNGTIFKVQWRIGGWRIGELDWTDLPGSTYSSKKLAQTAIDREKMYEMAAREQATWTVCK